MHWVVVTAGVCLLACAAQTEATVIVRNGRSDYQIVTPDKKSPAVGYAANELQGYLAQITGVRLPVVSESAAGDGPAFLLGPCKRSVKAGLVEQAGKLHEDGVLIKTEGDDIALLGSNERGNLYSVYVLLEKYLGVRFLAWDCTVVPKDDHLSLPNLDYSYAPPFMYRETLYWNSFPKEIAARQRLNGPATKCDATVGGKIDFYPYVHSFDDLFPPEEYFKDHLEYFGLQGGKRVAEHIHAQLCLTNPDVLRLAKEKVLKWIDERPDVPIIDVSQNDGNGACECEKCMAIVNEEGSQHGPILRFVNAIADEVAKKHPEKWVETLAYAYSTKPPAITKPRPNVIIRLCHAGCYYHGFEKCGLGANLTSYIEQWSKLTKRIFIWHYATDFAHYLAPNQNLAGLAKDIKYYGSHSVNGVMVQCNYQGPGGELAELREYLSAQLMWDPTQDPMNIRTEFCKGYYGEAATDVLEFLRLMDKVAENPDVHAFGAWDPQNTVSPEFVEGALRILGRARVATDSRTVGNRVDKLMLPFWYMRLSYPAKYGLSEKDAPAVWKQTKRVITANKITHIHEGDVNELAWVADMDSRYAAAPLASWVNALKPKGELGAEITLAKGGKALYTILIPAAPSTQEQKAAADLAQWLGEMTGARFAVSIESDAPKGNVISIGNTALLVKSGSKIGEAKLGDEGYAIDEQAGNLFLVGGVTRGPINAVYALLEEDLGCRWYSRFSQTIPNRPTLKLRPAKRSYVPVLEIRDPYYWEAFDGTWSLRNRTNSSNAPVPVEWGGNKAYALFVHTFSTLVPPDKYFKDHPEYFSENNGQRNPGQLCVTNPDVVKITADSVKLVLRGNPNAQIISVSQNDSYPCCACAKCKAESDSEGSLAGPLLKFVNAVADEVGKEYPKVKISTLAYLDTFLPPKTVKPHSNVVIQLCTDSHAWSEPFLTIEETQKFQAAMKDWALIGANMDIWDYTCNFSHYAGPMPNWQVVTDSIRFFVKHNAKGVMLQGNYQTPGTSDGYMRCWVWGKLLWDPTLDTRALMKDFVFGYYGKAAGPVWDYEELLWNTWENERHGKLKSLAGGIRYAMTLFDQAFMTKAKDCFMRAAKLAGDPETLRRVEEAELQILNAELMQASQSGKPTDPAAFKTALDSFERIARRQKMTHIQEGAPDFESWIAKMRALAQR